ncbi:unnamed protein product [Effrenium voratum]|nr:unnamed protein product [Effrenium voratum]
MPSFRSKLDKNVVYFRFAHEGQALEKVEFYGKEIAVGDLRHTIAEMKKLPKVDLQIMNETTGEVYARDGHLLHRNVIVTVRRTPVQTQKRAQVLNLEGADIFAPVKKAKKAAKVVEPEVPEQKAPCPPEYLCPVCRGLFEDPAIARCCGRSACAVCFKEHSSGFCPLCSREEEQKPLPNPRLAEIIGSLNLDYFELPSVTVARQAAARGPGGCGNPLSATGAGRARGIRSDVTGGSFRCSEPFPCAGWCHLCAVHAVPRAISCLAVASEQEKAVTDRLCF